MAVSRPRYLDRAPTAIPQFNNGASFLGVYMKSKREEYEKALELAKAELGAAYEHEQFKMDYLLKLEKQAASQRAGYKKGARGGALATGMAKYNTAVRADQTFNLKLAQKATQWTALSDKQRSLVNDVARSKIMDAASRHAISGPSAVLEAIRSQMNDDPDFLSEVNLAFPEGEFAKPEIVRQLFAAELTRVLGQDGGGHDYDPDEVARVFGEIAGLRSTGPRLTSEIAGAASQAELERERLMAGVADTASPIRRALSVDYGYDIVGELTGAKAQVLRSDIGNLPEVRAVAAPPAGAVRDTPADVAAEWAATISDTYNLEPTFASKIVEVAGNVGASPGDLANLIDFETGHTFNPAQKNLEGSSGTGLIQFMASTATKLGTTTAELAQMSQVEQMAYVEKYLQGHVGAIDLSTPEGLSAAVFYPRSKGDRNFNIYQDYLAEGKPEMAELFKKQNPGIETLGEYHDKLLKGAKIVQPPSVADAQQAATPAPTQDVDALLASRVDFPSPVTADAVTQRAGEIFNTEGTLLGKIQQRRKDRLGRKAISHMNNLPREQRILWDAAQRAQAALKAGISLPDEGTYGLDLAGYLKSGSVSMEEVVKMAQELAATNAGANDPESIRKERDRILDAMMGHNLETYRSHLASSPGTPTMVAQEQMLADVSKEAAPGAFVEEPGIADTGE